MNDDFLKRFRKSPRGEFARQLHEQLVQQEREKFMRTNHTHKEKQDMTTIAIPQSYYPPRTGGGHLVAWLAAVLAIAFAFNLMIGYTANRSIFTGLFQDAEERQRDVVQVYINQVWNSGDTARLDSLLTADHITATTIFGTVEGVEGVANLIAVYRTAMPDFLYTINRMDSEDGQVWLRGTITGTHTGTFILPDGTEIPPSGNPVTIDSVIRFTFTDGKISAINQVDSSQDLMEQFGAAQSVDEVATQNHNLELTLLTHDRSLPLPQDDIPREKYAEFNPFAYMMNIPFGDHQALFAADFRRVSEREQFASLITDREVEIRNVTAGGEFIAFHTAASGIYNPDHPWQSLRYDEAFLLSGEKMSWENVSIYHIRRNPGGRIVFFDEGWWYWDFKEMAAYDYGWTREDE